METIVPGPARAYATDVELGAAWLARLGLQLPDDGVTALERTHRTDLTETSIVVVTAAASDPELVLDDALEPLWVRGAEIRVGEQRVAASWAQLRHGAEPGDDAVLVVLDAVSDLGAESVTDLALLLWEAREEAVDGKAELALTWSRLAWIRTAVTSWIAAFDRAANFVRLDERVDGLVDVMARRFAEARLKWAVGLAELDDNTVEPISLPEEDGLFLDGVPAGRLAWPRTDFTVSEIRADIDRWREGTTTRLEALIALAAAQTDDAARRSDRAMNMVLYWLGIITLGFGVLAIFDKYKSADTQGLPWQVGLETSLLWAAPLVGFFLLTMVRHGMLSRTLSRLARGAHLTLLDLTLYRWWGSFLFPVPRLRRLLTHWTGESWVLWSEWKTVKLVEGPLDQLQHNPDPEDDDYEKDLETLWQNEVRAQAMFDQLFSDLDNKAEALYAEPTSLRTSALLGRLRGQILVNSALFNLRLELPDILPSIAVYAVMLLKLPTMPTTIAHRANRETWSRYRHRDYLGRYAWLHADHVSGRTIWLEFRALTLTLLRGQLNNDESDEQLWQRFTDQVLDGSTLDDDLFDVLHELDLDDVNSAYEPLSKVTLLEGRLAHA